MYCKNCGALIEESANFCPNCASRVNETAVAVKKEQTLQENGRNEMLKQIDIAKSYAAAIQNNYNNILGLEKEKGLISQYRSSLNFISLMFYGDRTYQNSTNKLFKSKKNNDRVCLYDYLKHFNYDLSFVKKYKLVDTILGVLVLLFFAYDLYALRYVAEKNIVSFLVIYLLLVIAIFVCLIMRAICFKKNYKKLLDDRERSISAQSQELYNNSNAILCEYQQKNGVIPEKYCCLYALDYLRDCIVSKRADNFKEAFNLFEAYEMQQQAIRKNDENFARLYKQQQDMFNTYRRNEAVDGVIDSLILLGVLFG